MLTPHYQSLGANSPVPVQADFCRVILETMAKPSHIGILDHTENYYVR